MALRRRNTKERRLAQAAARGEGGAWDELIRRYGRAIYNVAYRFAGPGTEAEDLTQEIFLKLYRNLHRYRGDVPLMAWALRLSHNLCIEHYRRTAAERRAVRLPAEALDGIPAVDDPGRTTQRRQRLRLVERALSEMNQDMALALVLRDLQGLSYEETAVFLEVPLGTLKSRLVRARREVARRVAEIVAGDSARRPVGPEAGEVTPC